MSYAAYCSAISCTVLSYPAPYWALLPSLFWSPLYPLSYTAPSELCCTPLCCACILLSYNTPFWATLHPVELRCSLLSYTLSPRTTLHLLSDAASLSHGALYRAKLQLTELRCTLRPIEVRCTLLNYTASPYELAHLHWATLHPSELPWTLLNYVVPYWGMLFSTEQCSTMWSTLQPNWATFSNRTFVQLCKMPECRTVWYRNKGTPVRYRKATVPDWDAGCQNTEASGISLHADAQLWRLGRKTIYQNSSLKGTVSRDFRHLVFFMNQFPPIPWVYHEGRFEFFRKFAEIFAAKGLPPVSTTPVANANNLQS